MRQTVLNRRKRYENEDAAAQRSDNEEAEKIQAARTLMRSNGLRLVPRSQNSVSGLVIASLFAGLDEVFLVNRFGLWRVEIVD